MSNLESNLDNLKAQIRPRLKDFLIAENCEIQNNGMLKCINPQHNDTNASMKLLADINNEQLWCYGCLSNADIFTAHHWLKKAPLIGFDFIYQNIYVLAKKFNISYEEVEFTQEQIERIEQFNFNAIIVSKLTKRDERGEPINWTDKPIIDRGWNPKTCEKLSISSVLDYSKLLRDIQQASEYTLDEIRFKGLSPELFGPDYITITMFDEKNRPIGFTARNLKWSKENDKVAKYKNSAHSPVFQKGKVLYGMNLVRNFKNKRLDIFEGNGSFITAYGAGHNSCVALSGSSLSEEQVKLIQELGFTHINLVLDNDSTGKEKTQEYMGKLSGREGLRVEFTRLAFTEEDLKAGLKDPDDFIKKYGLGAFFKNKPVGAYDWFLEKEADAIANNQVNIVEFVSKMIRVILNTSNRVERGRQLAKLSEVTKVPENDIRDEMDRILSVSTDKVKINIAKKLNSAKDTDEICAILSDSKDSIERTVGSKESRTILSIEEVLDTYDDMVNILDNKKPGIQGWITGFQILDTRLSGIPKPVGLNELGESIAIPGTIIGIAGAPQAGKSVIAQNLALRIAQLNSDVNILFWCLDDSKQRTFERMLAMMSGVAWNKVTRRVPINNKEKEKLKIHIEEFRELISSGRISFKDHSNGSSLPMLKKWVELTKESSNKPILIVVDSFHKIHATDAQSGYTETAKVKKFSEEIKSFVQKDTVSIIASLELNKTQTRGMEPDLSQITDSRKMEYDFDILCTVYNHFYDMDGNSEVIIKNLDNSISPLIKFNIRKSKDGGSGPLYFSLNTNNFQVKDYTAEDIARMGNLKEVNETNIGGIKIKSPDNGMLKSNTLEPWNTF